MLGESFVHRDYLQSIDFKRESFVQFFQIISNESILSWVLHTVDLYLYLEHICKTTAKTTGKHLL